MNPSSIPSVEQINVVMLLNESHPNDGEMDRFAFIIFSHVYGRQRAMKNNARLSALLLIMLLTACSRLPTSTPDISESDPTPPPKGIYAKISQEHLFNTLEALTSIQPYSGWRNSASSGEREALDFIEDSLRGMQSLEVMGMTLERQEFHVFLGTELWETRLFLTVGDQEIEVPADGLRGPRDDIENAAHFDSDGELNDLDYNPLSVEGAAILVNRSLQIHDLQTDEIRDKIIFLDYALIDRILQDRTAATALAAELIEKRPAGLILVTSFSNQRGESHGTFVGDTSVLDNVDAELPPTLYVRLEDLEDAGINTFQDIQEIDSARLVWDADVLSPAPSANLIAHIPGEDPSRAVILGAHIDSPNAPGAMDDGSGSAILLEIARVLDEANYQPPQDLYLAWFGSEELGLYGSSHFVTTHQELLDRTVAMLEIDCLTRPLDDIDATLDLVGWSYRSFGYPILEWPEYLTYVVGNAGIDTFPVDIPYPYSDNSVFEAYAVPNADLIYENEWDMQNAGGVHYAGHIHDPYDTVELAAEVADVLVNMTHVALTAAIEIRPDIELRTAPEPEKRALFIASHTESVHMTPSAFADLGKALAMEGFDLDVIPYGQRVTTSDLQDADVVVVLPIHDYPAQTWADALYDESWEDAELIALDDYVSQGGFLIVTNSTHRVKFGGSLLDANEDWADQNPLVSTFGITFQEDAYTGKKIRLDSAHPLMEGLTSLTFLEDNGVPFSSAEGRVLAWVDDIPAITFLESGSSGGEVLILADFGFLFSTGEGPVNLPFWQNLARYTIER
jgi:hypothetical protein